ncbi:MAG TPA: hypothetical protein VIG74_02520 [Alphaproteobacteria bacterium]
MIFTEMDQRTIFLIQVLEKIGTPLTAAVTAATLSGRLTETARQDAQRVAELLNRSVQLGLSIAESMNVNDAAQADGVHLSLAAFSGPLIASQYQATGRVPGDQDIRRMATALQAVLTFADSFTPAADDSLRLENMNAGDQPADEALIHVQMLQAFAPVLQVVGEYAFGKPENKLIQDISNRLMTRVEDLNRVLFQTPAGSKVSRQVELVLLRLVAALYAACHRTETLRLMAMNEQERSDATITMDGVWSTFDRRTEMIRVIAEEIVPGKRSRGKASSTSGGQKALPKQTAKKEAEEEKSMPGGNPMAFFKTKKATKTKH